MKVIFKTDVNPYKKGEMAEVSDGYAKNFLIKKGLAEEANADAVNSLKLKKDAEAYHKEQEKKDMIALAEKIKNLNVTLSLKGGEHKPFGSVTSKEISEKLSDLGFNIDKRQIIIKEPIKTWGSFIVDIKLMENVTSRINVIVEKVTDNK